MGGALGALLAGSSVPVKDWEPESDEKQDKLLLAEGFLVGFLLLGVYVFISLEVFPTPSRWEPHFVARSTPIWSSGPAKFRAANIAHFRWYSHQDNRPVFYPALGLICHPFCTNRLAPESDLRGPDFGGCCEAPCPMPEPALRTSQRAWLPWPWRGSRPARR